MHRNKIRFLFALASLSILLIPQASYATPCCVKYNSIQMAVTDCRVVVEHERCASGEWQANCEQIAQSAGTAVHTGFGDVTSGFDKCASALAAAGVTPAEPVETFEPVLPKLQIPIFTLTPFTTPTKQAIEGGKSVLLIDFLGTYLVGLYKFLVGISSITAGVMIVWAGLKWLTSAGNPERISDAKHKIGNASIGLILVLGSYVILNIVNPELVFFKPLRVEFVERIELELRMGTTTADTSEGLVSGSVPGSHTPTFTSCPFTLSSPRVQSGGGARAAEFYEQVRTSGIINGATIRDRAVQIADAAAACDTNFGSCGRTAGTILALAGVGDQKCLSPASGNCNGNNGPQIHGISQNQRSSIYGMRCDFEGANGQYAKYKREDCGNTASEATAKIRTYLQSEATAGRLSGWPDQWANDLRPGDYFVVYNGNKDLVGSHAVIFVGWASDGNSAQVIQGGGAAWKTRGGSICIKGACGDRMKPLLYIWTP